MVAFSWRPTCGWNLQNGPFFSRACFHMAGFPSFGSLTSFLQHGSWLPTRNFLREQAPICKCLSGLMRANIPGAKAVTWPIMRSVREGNTPYASFQLGVYLKLSLAGQGQHLSPRWQVHMSGHLRGGPKGGHSLPAGHYLSG